MGKKENGCHYHRRYFANLAKVSSLLNIADGVYLLRLRYSRPYGLSQLMKTAGSAIREFNLTVLCLKLGIEFWLLFVL